MASSMSSRQAGWAAVASPQAAREAYYNWNEGFKLTISELTLARDFAHLNRFRVAVEELNADLRSAVCKAVQGR